MKRCFSIILCFISTFTAKAQPVLTAANYTPSIGENYTWVVNQPASPGPSGANVIWNCTALSYLGTSNLSVVSPSAISSNSMFPGANFSYSISTGQYHTLTATTNTLFQNTNNNGSFLSTYCTVDPEEVLRFPFTYLNSFTDKWKGKWISGCTFTPCIRSGTTTVVADGYGTIILPVGTYSNVLRVTHYVTVIDSVWMGSWSVQTNSTTRYNWYIPGLHHPIAYREGFTHPSASYLAFCYISSIPMSISSNESSLVSLNSFPNPTSDKINFYITDKNLSDLEINIYDLNGLLVLNNTYKDIAGVVSLDVSGLAEGVYFARIKNQERVSKNIRFVVIK